MLFSKIAMASIVTVPREQYYDDMFGSSGSESEDGDSMLISVCLKERVKLVKFMKVRFRAEPDEDETT